MFQYIQKPWFIHRPSQVAVRAFRALRSPTPGLRLMRLAWGASISADPTKDIGRCIWHTAVYDIAVSEVLARLIHAGDTVLDGGVNIGYMTLLSAALAGPSGQVIAFEPHPSLYMEASANVARSQGELRLAPVDLRQTALGEREGVATLILPVGFGANNGIARIATAGDNAETTRIDVAMETIDVVMEGKSAEVLKLDVEGYEAQALRGGTRALSEQRIKHILFEDHKGLGSEVITMLEGFGCEVFALGWSVAGPEISPIRVGLLAKRYEAASYLATFDPEGAAKSCAPRGWRVLDRKLATRR